MDTRKLFRVLVTGGALLGTACLEDEEPARSDAGVQTDGGAANGDDAGVAAGDAGELINCGICPTTECCVTEADGTAHERAGMMCCWGSSC